MDSLSASDQIMARNLMALEAQVFDELNLHGFQKIIRERRIWVGDSGAHMDSVEEMGNGYQEDSLWSGKSDLIYLKDEQVYVFNYKTGATEPPPIEKDWQMRTEGIAAATFFKTKQVLVGRLQPFAKKQIALLEIDETQLAKDRNKAADAAVMSVSEGGQFKPGTIQCEWCAAKSICRAYQDQDKPKGMMAYMSLQERTEAMQWAWTARKESGKVFEAAADVLRVDNEGIPGFYLDVKHGEETIAKELNIARSEES